MHLLVNELCEYQNVRCNDKKKKVVEVKDKITNHEQQHSETYHIHFTAALITFQLSCSFTVHETA